MIKHRCSLPLMAVIAFGFGWTTSASADNLLMNRVQQENGMDLPTRGMSMTQVERKYGAPSQKLSPRGGGKPHQPVINRWEYANFIVYFEHDHVIHAVLNTPAGNNLHPATTQ